MVEPPEMIPSTRKGKTILSSQKQKIFQVPGVYQVFSDFERVPRNDSKFQVRQNYSKFPETKNILSAWGVPGVQ